MNSIALNWKVFLITVCVMSLSAPHTSKREIKKKKKVQGICGQAAPSQCLSQRSFTEELHWGSGWSGCITFRAAEQLNLWLSSSHTEHKLYFKTLFRTHRRWRYLLGCQLPTGNKSLPSQTVLAPSRLLRVWVCIFLSWAKQLHRQR